MKNFFRHTRVYIFRGLLAVIPLFLSLLAIQLVYVVIDKRVVNLIDQYVGYRVPGLGVLLVLVFLYFVGLLASNVVGHRFFGIIERVSRRIPLVKTIYQVGKQVSSTFSLPEKQVFKRVVLVNFKAHAWTVGFVTGTIEDKRNNGSRQLLKIFVPTAPNPTSGFVFILEESEVLDPQWSVEEGLRIVISGGIIGPDTMGEIKQTAISGEG